MYQLKYSKESLKTLKKIQKTSTKLILKKLQDLAKDPYAKNNNVTALQGIDGYRLRIGDWRIIYDVIDEELIIIVIKIKPRGGAYGL